MTVEQSDVIDRVAAARDGHILLAIFDHLPWVPFETHHALLLAKLNAYLEFIEGGQLVEDYPNSAGKELELRVFCKYRPSEEALAFFGRIAPEVELSNARLGYGPAVGMGYDDDES